MDIKDLAVRIAKCDSEIEVISLLKKANFWNNDANWKPFGANENNFSTIGNQQSAPDAALVEKLVNSVDAVLLKECLILNIDPESLDAPQSIPEALKKFYNIKDGKISNLDTKQRNKMSKSIIMAATGAKSKPNYVIVDEGEGQTPKQMPETILSLGKSNKLRVPFVQGKFNMGGTGVLQFCGEHNLQLIISKRCQQIQDEDDITKDYFGFTVVRRDNPSLGRRSSMYTYLANEDGSILSFTADKLDIIPTPSDEYKAFEYGMYIKLYEYQIPGLRTNILFDLNYRLALLMPNLAHPVRLVECRDYKGHTFETTLSGLNVRLSDDKKDNVEDGFPVPLIFDVDGQKFNASIFVFKEEANDKNYRTDEGIIFSVNGQTHGNLSKSFFKRSSVNLSYLANSLLIIVDCTDIDGRTREDLFMNSRDRLREGEIKKKIEKALEEYLRQHEGLKALQEERRRNAIAKRLSDEKPLVEVLNNILKKSPTLAQLFLSGIKLKNPFNLAPTNTANAFKGKPHPTFFTLKNKPKKGIYTRNVPINHKFRVQFETDAVNDYFNRENEPGKYKLSCLGKNCTGYGMHLFNGVASLTVELPQGTKPGDNLKFEITVTDECLISDFKEEFIAVVGKPEEYNGSGVGTRKKPSGNDKKGKGEKLGGLALPETIELYQPDWQTYDLTREDALIVRNSGTEGVYDFYINMDNIHLNTELKNIRDDSKVKLTQARYKYSMVLIGLSIINYIKTLDGEQNDDLDLEKYVNEVSNMISPVILPLIQSMGDLNFDEITHSDIAYNEVASTID